MNGLFMPWGNPSVNQVQPWAKEYIIRTAAPWPKGMSRENQLDNLISYSTYNASTWQNIFVSTASITNGINDPNGTNNAIRFTLNNTGNALLRVSFPSFIPNGIDKYTYSFYAKKISGSGTAYADLHDSGQIEYSSLLVTNTWIRISYSFVPTNTVKNFIDLFSDNNNNYVIDFWGVQLENSPVITAYIPKNGQLSINENSMW